MEIDLDELDEKLEVAKPRKPKISPKSSKPDEIDFGDIDGMQR